MCPIVDSLDNVFFGTEAGQFFALDKNGAELWHMDLPVYRMRTSPVTVEDGVLYVIDGARLYSLREPN